MKIHNFLCDLLVSTKLLFDNYLFQDEPGLIKSYQFNIGNRSFQLGREPFSNYELPAIISAINDETINFNGRRTDLIMRNQLENTNKIPVLYNETRDVGVFVHEEQTFVSFTIAINCESQLHAKELAYTIKRSLPLNKHLNILNFTTFLELIPDFLFNKLQFDIIQDTIHNLYTKLNYNTGKPEYCFSLNHNPLIRLDSITSAVQDSSTSTFQVLLDLTYVIPFPQFLIVDKYYEIQTINFSFNVEHNSPVLVPFTKHYIGLKPNYKIDRTLLLTEESTRFPDSVIISKTPTQAFLSIKFELNDFVIQSDYKYRFSKIFGDLRDPIIQEPTYYYQEENRVVFIFDIETYNQRLKPELTQPLFIDFYHDDF